MKESGIDKLIELLNEYCKEKKIGRWSILENGCLFHGNKPINNKKEEFDLLVISKHYGFIKWLVDNDKIDFSNIKRIILNYKVEDNEAIDYYDLDFATKEETLLMILSISNTPIEDLISYLK